jgi:hypothetical protein
MIKQKLATKPLIDLEAEHRYSKLKRAVAVAQ